MDELEREMIGLMNELNQVWVKESRLAHEEQRYIDAMNVMGSYSEIVNKVKESFNNCKVRLKLTKPVTKKGLFGGL